MNKKKLITILTIIGLFSGLQLLAAQTGLFSYRAKVATQHTTASLAKQKTSLPASSNQQPRQRLPSSTRLALDQARLTAFKSVNRDSDAAMTFKPGTIASNWEGNKGFSGRIPDFQGTTHNNLSTNSNTNPAVFFQQPTFTGDDDPGTGSFKDSIPLIYYLAEPGTPSFGLGTPSSWPGTPSSGLPPFWMEPEDGSILVPGGGENPNQPVVPIPTSFLLFASGLIVIIFLRKMKTGTKTALIGHRQQLSHPQ